MRINRILIWGAALAALLSCSKENQPSAEIQDGQIHFEMGLSSSTKVTSSAFEKGDRISLYAVEYLSEEKPELQIGGNWLNNVKLTYDGADWTAPEKIYWSTRPCDFYAIYPALEPRSIEAELFEIRTDQDHPGDAQTLGGYEASDLLFAEAEKISRESNGGTVKLDFRHMMSKCVVNLIKGEKFEGEIPEDVVVHIYNTTTTAQLNISNGSLQAYGLGNRNTITMRKLSKTRHEAIVVPQNIEFKTPLIEVTMGGIAYLLEYSLSFKPGFCSIINLTVNTSPDQEMIEIEIDAETGDM